MSALAMTLHQLRYENRSFWRNPASAGFTFAFPLMFLIIFNGLFGGTVGTFGRETSASNFYVPAVATFSVITASFTNLAISVSFLRDEGILKRIRGTPLPTSAYLLGRVIHATLIAILLVLIVSLFGVFFYDVDVPTETLPALVLIVLVGAASFCALGLAFTAVIPNADAAPPMVNFAILPLLFISDVFIPLDDAPGWLVTLSKVFPVKHYSAAMLAAFHPFDPSFKGGELIAVAAWGAIGIALAVKFFSWEPKR